MTLEWLAVAAALAALGYAAGVAALVAAGRSSSASAAARALPDSVVLMRRLINDPRVPRRRKGAILAAIVYVAVPIDLIPDFVPVAGQLDDVLVVAVALRYLLRAGGPELLEELWPGPADSLTQLLRLAYGREPLEVGASPPASRRRGSSRHRRRSPS